MDRLEPISRAEASRFDVRSGDGELGKAWVLRVLDPVGLRDPQGHEWS